MLVVEDLRVKIGDEATSTIVRGFLSVDIPGLAPQLKAEIDRAIETSDRDVM